jgi:hypothetical protein
MPTIDLTPTIPDGDEFVSEMIKVRQNEPVTLQSYGKAVFTVEASIDEKTFHPITNVVEPGLYSLDPIALVIRVRAASLGEAPYALFLYLDP